MSNNPQLDEFIQSSRAAGQTDESIKVDLIQAGWDLPSIEDALAPSIVPTNSPVELTPASNSHNQFKKYRKPVAAVLVLVLLGLGGWKAYSYFMSNPEKIWADTQGNMMDVKTAKFSLEASYTDTVPEGLKEEEQELVDYFGDGVTFSITANGALSLNKEETDFDYDMTSKLETKLSGFTISFDFQSKKISDFVYYKKDGNFLLSLLGGLGEEEEGKSDWIKMNIKEGQNKDLVLIDSQRTQLLDAFKKSKFMAPTKLINSEKVDGVNTWHYEASLDKQELKNYLNEVTKILEYSDEEMKSAESLLDKMEFRKLEVWVGKSDHLVHQALIESNAPSFINSITGSLDEARNKARDARRLADVRQIQTALELHFNDNGRYPTATNGQPTPTDGGKYKFSSYIANYPQSPEPLDGTCTVENNKYNYQQVGNDSYKLTFCLGNDAGGFKAGVMEASPSGIKTITPSNTGPVDEFAGIPFTASIRVQINLSDFNKTVNIEEPKDAKDVTEPNLTN